MVLAGPPLGNDRFFAGTGQFAKWARLTRAMKSVVRDGEVIILSQVSAYLHRAVKRGVGHL
jgi:hypothetical protein